MHSCASVKRFTVMDVDFVSVSKFFGSCLCQDLDFFFSLSLAAIKAFIRHISNIIQHRYDSVPCHALHSI